jgi:hypothetical protein
MSSAAPGGGSAAAAAAEATAAAAPAAARINHSKLVVGSMYSFSTEGCPNVTITSKKNMGNEDGNSSVDAISGKGVCIDNAENYEDRHVEGDRPDIFRREISGYTDRIF